MRDREVPEIKNAHLREVICTQCGMATNKFFDDRWICECASTRVEQAFGISKLVNNWEDVMTKLDRLYCLNELERQSGFEPTDVVLEEGSGYCLVKDQNGLLLIVVHDGTSGNLLAKIQHRMKPKIVTIRF